MAYSKSKTNGKGFGENEGQTQRVDYQGRTPEGFANMAAAQSVEQQFTAVNDEAKKFAYTRMDNATMLASRYYLQMQADGTQEKLFKRHLDGAEQAANEQRQKMMDQINGFFMVSEVKPENFTRSLSGASSQLKLGGS